MFGGRKKNSDHPIGLDVGDHGVKLMQLASRNGKLAVTSAAQARLPEGLKADSPNYLGELSNAIGQALSAGNFVGQNVVSSLPASSLQCKNLRLPTMPADELAAAVQWEAADRFGYGDKQTSAQFLVAGQVQQGEEQRQEIILLATKLGWVEGHVSALTENSLRPKAVDATPAALARLTHTWGSETDLHVMVDIGRSTTKVLIVRDGQVVFYKPIEVGGAELDSAMSGTMRIPLDEARERREALDVADAEEQKAIGSAIQPVISDLGREIGLCLRYYGVTFRGARPETGKLLGGVASHNLAKSLGQASGLTLTLEGALGDIDLSEVRQIIKPGAEHTWAVAAGLSLRDHTPNKPTATGPQAQSGVAA